MGQCTELNKPAGDENARRQAHEAAEAKRRAEWEARQEKKRVAEQAQLARLAAMAPDEIAVFSAKRVKADTERLTRRNMKDSVSEHIQAKCQTSTNFARQVLDPHKTMVRCFQYIYRQAREFAEREMKDLGETPVNGVYGLDIPDGLCFQWAEAYFNDRNAPEDKETEEEFVPRPFYGGKAAKPAEKTPPAKPRDKNSIDGQISLLGEVE